MNDAGVESSLRSQPVTVLDNKIPAYAGTVWIDPNIITEDDPTTYLSTTYVGRVMMLSVDGELNAPSNPNDIEAYHFQSFFEKDKIIDFYIHPDFTQEEAEGYVIEYSAPLGRLPAFLFNGVNRVNIQESDGNWTGGGGLINAHVGAYRTAVLEQGVMEEIFVHEASHASIQHINNDTAYLAAAEKDPSFSSTYAQDYFLREDVAETILSYLAYRYRAERMPEDMIYNYRWLIPNRIEYFDNQDFDMYPWKE